MAKFSYFPITIPQPSFDSNIIDCVMRMYSLKSRANLDQIVGSTPKVIFDQLKFVFHLLESIYSARIEGNHTTIAKYFEQKTEPNIGANNQQKIKEIDNIEQCLFWLESIPADDLVLDQDLLKTIHKKITIDLAQDIEGDQTPGNYRVEDNMIGKSEHLPPPFEMLPRLMTEFEDFMNQDCDTKYELLKIAIAHHRLAWIHPFGNGNGRTVRVWTYAMLLKYGYVKNRIINPTAVFCTNRNDYYNNLALADLGTTEGQLSWCEYVLSGMCQEFTKIDELNDFQKTKFNILIPAIDYLLHKGSLGDMEAKILRQSLDTDNAIFGAIDLKINQPSYTISRIIKKMLQQELIINISPRKYTINLKHPKIIISVAYQLESNGFLAEKVDNIL